MQQSVGALSTKIIDEMPSFNVQTAEKDDEKGIK